MESRRKVGLINQKRFDGSVTMFLQTDGQTKTKTKFIYIQTVTMLPLVSIGKYCMERKCEGAIQTQPKQRDYISGNCSIRLNIILFSVSGSC